MPRKAEAETEDYQDDSAAQWFGEDVATFGDRLAAAREAAGMKRSEFAKRLGVRKSTVGDWEDDLSEPRANRVQMMAGLLNVSVGWLLTGEGDGVDVPDDDNVAGHDPDLLALLSELRDIRARMKHDLERLARVEKALRKQGGPHG